MSQASVGHIDKLVRDKIPQILRERGIKITERILDDQEYITRLKDKLLEEAHEVVMAADSEALQEELADVLEVVMALASTHNLLLEDIEKHRKQKKLAKGGFEGRVHLKSRHDVA